VKKVIEASLAMRDLQERLDLLENEDQMVPRERMEHQD
jgi:hypothetical protein